MTLAVVVGVFLESHPENPLDAISDVYVFSSRTIADVWTERKAREDPTIGFGTFSVDLDLGVTELPRSDAL